MKLFYRATIGLFFMIGILLASSSSTFAQVRPFYVGVFGGVSVPQDMTWKSIATGQSIDLGVDNTGVLGFKGGYILPQARMIALA